MEYGTEKKTGKQLRAVPEIVKDRHGSLRLELERGHPNLVQHLRYHTQGWRANGDNTVTVHKTAHEHS